MRREAARDRGAHTHIHPGSEPQQHLASELGRADTAVVGGKNASLGEMIAKLKQAGIRVPGGVATIAAAYWRFLDHNRLRGRLAAKLGELAEDAHNLAAVGKAVREGILGALTRGYDDKTEYFVDRLARREPLLRRRPPRGLRARMPRAAPRARGAGLDEHRGDDPVLPHPEEPDRVLEEMSRHGLRRGKGGLQIFVMCEIPSNVILAEQFAARFDGFSIGSNDLTQLVLGVDRDSDVLSALFDERNEAVTEIIAELLAKARRSGTKTGICGQAPSTHPEFARSLVAHGIDSMSVTQDSFLAVKRVVASTESSHDGLQPNETAREGADAGR